MANTRVDGTSDSYTNDNTVVNALHSYFYSQAKAPSQEQQEEDKTVTGAVIFYTKEEIEALGINILEKE